MKAYEHKRIEKKWQALWKKKSLYKATEKKGKKKSYLLIEFPYPSGQGLHVGHVRSYTALDVVARKRRAEGENVLYPIGWDAFGLPTENYAIKTGIHPIKVTKDNSNNFRRQLQALGFSFDWSREVNTSDPAYYKWTQWIFIQLFKAGLAYKAKSLINWCPKCKIGLANEEVIDNKCERCGAETEKKEKEQWMLSITKYAERLDKDLDTVDFEERIKLQQRNWIGRREGAQISFRLISQNGAEQTQKGKNIEVFTTRPDTLFGATYLVLAPEHPLLRQGFAGQAPNKKEIEEYIKSTKAKTDIERTAEGKEKTGVEIKGVKAINPANQEELPIFIADYVLPHYGTGAIMAVPAHDERDFEFAKKFKLSLRQVIEPMFSQSTEPGKVRPGVPFDERNSIMAIVKHWQENKYLALKWKEVAWGTFITGGVENGQTPEEAAKREIREETGYLNPVLEKNFGVLHGKFYHLPKNTNRFVHSHTLLFKLEDAKKQEISREEHNRHEILWLSLQELHKFLTPDSHLRALEILVGKEVYVGEGILKNSGEFDGMDSSEAKKKITKVVGGKWVTTFKLRDWVFSRQRYWGEPIPLIYCEECARLRGQGWVPVPEKDLPVKLPNVKKYQPTDTGESPLAAMEGWVKVKCPICKGPARRETDVMPNWAGSSWYFLRYTDPKNNKEFASKKKLAYWLGPAAPSRSSKSGGGVDWYNGGMEHTTLHLLYSRFWHKFLYDLKLVPTSEPYKKRTSHGNILAPDGQRMSKSRGNVINPEDPVARFGADSLRLYEMFVGPFAQEVAWNTNGLVGMYRFLERAWRARERVSARAKTSLPLDTLLHQTIKKVSEDIEEMHFNTALSQLMVLLNSLEKEESIPLAAYKTLLRLLAPFAPHITEEIWQGLKNRHSVHTESWPKYNPSKLMSAERTLAVQINGKVRALLSVPATLGEQEVLARAQALPEIQKWLLQRTLLKKIYVPGKVLNFVLRGET